jgi:hypothetical protein
MRHLAPVAVAAVVVAAVVVQLAAGRVGEAAEITTEQLHAASPLARALNARVRPAAASAVEPVGPSWLTMLTPRNASAQLTEVLGDELSTTEIDLRSTHGLRGVPPFVTVTPAVQLLTVDGPTTEDFDAVGPDLPARLWGLSAGFTMTMPVSEQWIVQAGVSPGVYSDLENTSGDAFRIPGRILGIYSYSPQTQFTVGAVYLDREDISWVPALGVIHKPTDRTTFELILPRPRVVQQLWGGDANSGGFGYLAGELGGGSWAVERDASPGLHFDDVATLSDLRLLAGLEVKREGQVGFLAETGWVFNRDVEYESGVGDADFDDAWLFRIGIRK